MSKKEKVTVSKVKKRKKGSSTGWVSSEDVKKKKVTKARAERLEKRGWKKSFDTAPAPKKEVKVGEFTITTSSDNPIQKIKFGRKKKKKEGKTKLTQRERELRDFHTTGDPDYSYYDLGEAELNNPLQNREERKKRKLAQAEFRAEQSRKYGITEADQKKSEKQKSPKNKTKKEKTPEEIAKRRAKATDIVQSIGRSLAAAAGDDIKAPETTKMEEYEKGKRIDLSGGDKITGETDGGTTATTAFKDDPGEDNIVTNPIPISEEFRRQKHNESKADYLKAVEEWEASKTSPVQRKDLQNISAMMRKIKNPLKK